MIDIDTATPDPAADPLGYAVAYHRTRATGAESWHARIAEVLAALTAPVAGLEEIEALCEKATLGLDRECAYALDELGWTSLAAVVREEGITDANLESVILRLPLPLRARVKLSRAVAALLARVKAAEARASGAERCKAFSDKICDEMEAERNAARAERDEQRARADAAEARAERAERAEEEGAEAARMYAERRLAADERANRAEEEVARLRARLAALTAPVEGLEEIEALAKRFEHNVDVARRDLARAALGLVRRVQAAEFEAAIANDHSNEAEADAVKAEADRDEQRARADAAEEQRTAAVARHEQAERELHQAIARQKARADRAEADLATAREIVREKDESIAGFVDLQAVASVQRDQLTAERNEAQALVGELRDGYASMMRERDAAIASASEFLARAEQAEAEVAQLREALAPIEAAVAAYLDDEEDDDVFGRDDVGDAAIEAIVELPAPVREALRAAGGEPATLPAPPPRGPRG